jgi:predicted PurR-regulated permease PerM
VNAVRNPLPPSAPDPGTHRDLPALVAVIRRRNRLLTVVTLALALYGFYAARTLIVPIVFSILVSLVLAPVVRVLVSLRVPRLLATALVMFATIAAVTGLFVVLSDPAQQWLARAPAAIERLDHQIRDLRRPLRAATKATETLMNLGETQPAKPAVRVAPEASDAFADLLKAVPSILVTAFASLFLTFLLLLHGHTVLRKLMYLMRSFGAKRAVVVATRETQRELSRYLLTVSLINLCLGLATAGALWFLGMPDPLLWAGVIGLLNFAPYLGPSIVCLLLLLAGFANQATLPDALVAPGVFLVLHGLEGQLITPHLVGRQLALDPVVIFLGLLTFGWLWGIAGLLMAVPILACIKVIVQHAPEGRVWARMLVH